MATQDKHNVTVYLDTVLHREVRKVLIDFDKSFSAWVDEQMRFYLDDSRVITQDARASVR